VAESQRARMRCHRMGTWCEVQACGSCGLFRSAAPEAYRQAVTQQEARRTKKVALQCELAEKSVIY
jgi:hypothetical protein